jgi:transcription-repair coupling factor (superfamily II helicase)
MNQRLTVYRRMAAVRTDDDLARVLEEARDRYGPPPVSILNLADYARIRLLATRLGVESLDREGALVVLRFRMDAPVDPTFLIALVQTRRDVTLTPPAVIKLDLRVTAGLPPPRSALRRASPEQGDGGKPRLDQDARAPRAPARRGRPGERAEPSWWTSRATAGEVTSGFSKEEILRPPAEDPRAAGGIFARVSDLLDELSRGVRIG